MSAEPPIAIPHSPYVPYDPDIMLYDAMLRPFLIPWEYTGWRDEQLSWKTTAYVHGNLNPSPWTRITGPDASRFLESVCVNSFAAFPVGGGKHAILCNTDGLVMSHGVLIRTGEEEFEAQWLAPYLEFLLSQTDLDLEFENVSTSRFLFQIAGPRSYDVLAAATTDDLSDIRFMRHRPSTIAGHDIRVLRMGMGGSLAYEVHGDAEFAQEIYSAIVAAGEPFGIRRLGTWAYMMNHTENGYPQSFYHFSLAWNTVPEFRAWLSGRTMGTRNLLNDAALLGSVGEDMTLRYRTPFDLGWGSMVRFDHDFTGREALERAVADPPRRIVTLEWDVDDLVDVYRSQFELGEHFAPIDHPIHITRQNGGQVMYADRVLRGDELVGVSSGRAYSYYYRRMISLCSLERTIAEGEQVEVLWGPEASRQKRIRATVARYPYLDVPRNQGIELPAPSAR
ncbi:aminomethyltransferase family protein [Okibacterium endophyticum]